MIASINSSKKQQTLQNDFSLNGVGLHSGKRVSISVQPAKENNGIKFIRTDIKNNNIIDAIWSNVSSTNFCTTISNDYGISVSTIEHLMSALSGMHIDNANILIDNVEVPIMDGSSLPFVKFFEKNGIITQEIDRQIILVKKEIKVSYKDSYAKIIPNNEFSIDFEIDFDSDLINKQACQLQLINGNYISDISSARTFGFEKDVNRLRANGLALGGSLDNAVVVGENNILNTGGLRYDDEFVRHKILDSIGDLYLAGNPILGHFYGYKSGHFLNNLLLQKLFSENSNFELI
jgi:UDP-3-O-[3-hydroxymyristoyl] N-acetylglucosamine deacetylase